MSYNYPRVLLINNEPFHSGSATGLTMTSLFSGWPSDRLAVICPRPLPEHLNITDKIYQLSLHDLSVPIYFVPLFNLLMKHTNLLWDRNPTLIGKIYSRIIHLLFIFPYKLNTSLLKWVDGFKPDLIYSMLYDIDVMQLCLQISKKYSLPIAPHIMDDWPKSTFSFDPFRLFLYSYSNYLLKRILMHSRNPMVICDSMKYEYDRRYQADFTPFMRCIKDEDITNAIDVSTSSNPITFVYIGGLHLDRWRSLRDIGHAMQILNARGIAVKVEIYVHPHDVKAFGAQLNLPPVMSVSGSLSTHLVIEKQREADVLLHVEDFSPANVKFTKYSMSAKIPEYLATGKSLFAYGPADIASIEFLRVNDCACVVSQQNIESLVDAITNLIDSADYRRQISSNAQNVAKKRFAASVERERFRAHIQSVVNN